MNHLAYFALPVFSLYKPTMGVSSEKDILEHTDVYANKKVKLRLKLNSQLIERLCQHFKALFPLGMAAISQLNYEMSLPSLVGTRNTSRLN